MKESSTSLMSSFQSSAKQDPNDRQTQNTTVLNALIRATDVWGVIMARLKTTNNTSRCVGNDSLYEVVIGK